MRSVRIALPDHAVGRDIQALARWLSSRAKQRSGKKPQSCLPPSEGEARGPLPYHVDYQAAYQRHMKRHNARKPGDTHPAMHLIVGGVEAVVRAA